VPRSLKLQCANSLSWASQVVGCTCELTRLPLIDLRDVRVRLAAAICAAPLRRPVCPVGVIGVPSACVPAVQSLESKLGWTCANEFHSAEG